MSEPQEQETPEPTEPTIADVPEPDQEPHEPIPDEADEAPQEPAQEPAEAPESTGMTEVDWEARFKKSDRAFDSYARAIGKIWEEDGKDLLPVVVSPSAPPGFLNTHDAGRVPDEVKAPILEFFGMAREQDYEDDPETKTCRTCKGKTKTKTGSGDPQFSTRTCPTCKGWGFTIQGRSPNEAQTTTNGVVQDAPERAEPLATGEVDNWGEPKILPDGRLNPNFGKMPDHKVPVEPWGITRNLTAQDAVAGV